MATIPNPLEFNKYYHIFNRGINSCDIFREDTNYEYFLQLLRKYILPVSDCYAWVLMKNHFHFLVKIKDEKQILKFQKVHKLKNLDADKRLYQQFSNFFNAYAKSYNKKFNRTGSLFETKFRRKEVDDGNYLKKLLVYIHNNPVKHHFCHHPIEYPWSSYDEYLAGDPELQFGPEVKMLFKNTIEFKDLHYDGLSVTNLGIDWEF